MNACSRASSASILDRHASTIATDDVLPWASSRDRSVSERNGRSAGTAAQRGDLLTNFHPGLTPTVHAIRDAHKWARYTPTDDLVPESTSGSASSGGPVRGQQRSRVDQLGCAQHQIGAQTQQVRASVGPLAALTDALALEVGGCQHRHRSTAIGVEGRLHRRTSRERMIGRLNAKSPSESATLGESFKVLHEMVTSSP